MDREEFSRLEVEKQVEVFNKMLENSSIRKVCEKLKVGKTTIRKRFTKKEYIFSVDKNRYVKETAFQKEIESNHNLTKEEIKSNINHTDEMYENLLELAEIKDDLKAMASIWKETAMTSTPQLYIHSFNGKLCVKSIKLYEEVLEEFNRFIGEHRELKQQDIINQALWEFLQKYC